MEQIWWERVPNALAFLSDVTTLLREEKSLILHSSQTLPWPDTFAFLVRDAVGQHNASKRFETIFDVSEPGAYLLNHFCKPEKRAQYRPAKGYAAFLAEHDDIVLHGHYLWVKTTSLEQLDAWASFASDYLKLRSKTKEPAVFLLEWNGPPPPFRKKGIAQRSFEDYVGEHDRSIFAMLAASSIQGDAFLKSYLAELAANVIGNEIELYEPCLADYAAFLHTPYEMLTRCTQQACRSDGSPFPAVKPREEVLRAIWRTQIRTVYPMVEEFRQNFVRKHAAAIKAQLPIHSMYGEVYQQPYDVELGTLIYMAGSSKLSMSQEEYIRLCAFRDARNTLSHLGTLSLEEIKRLIP